MKRKMCCCLYLAVWLAFPCAVYAVWCAGCEVLIGTHWTEFRIQSVLNVIAAVIGVGFAVLRYRKSVKTLRNRAVLGGSIAGIAFLLLCGNFACAFLDGSQEYHSFRSPDGTHRIVVMENISLIAGRVTLYERVNPFLIQPKESVTTDDGHRPVCAGEYTLHWDGNAVTLSVSDGCGGEETLSAVLGER